MQISQAPHPGSLPGPTAIGTTQGPPPKADNDNDADKAKDKDAKGAGAPGSRGLLDVTA